VALLPDASNNMMVWTVFMKLYMFANDI